MIHYKYGLCRFQNSQFHHMKNAKGKFAFPNGNKGKGVILYISTKFIKSFML